jgi:transposase-like protein
MTHGVAALLVAQDRQRARRAPEVGAPAAKKALAEIHNAENKAAAVKAAHNFATEYGAKWPKAVAKIVDDLDVLTAFYDYPAEHWIHLRTTNPIESTLRPCGCGNGSPRDPAPVPPAW